MEHESFENDAVAAVLNEHFVVDQGRSRGAARRRSRLHDVRAGDDRVRRLADERLADAGAEAVLRRHVFPADVDAGDGRASSTSCSEIARVWRAERSKVSESAEADDRAAAIARAAGAGVGPIPDGRRACQDRRAVPAVVRCAPRRLRRRAEVSAAERAAVSAARARADRGRRRAGDGAATLRAMALGGMRDHVGGGFHRYSVDARLARPAFREDAVRPGAARARVSSKPRRCPAIRSTSSCGGHAPLRHARDDRQDGGFLLGRGRRQRAAGAR